MRRKILALAAVAIGTAARTTGAFAAAHTGGGHAGGGGHFGGGHVAGGAHFGGGRVAGGHWDGRWNGGRYARGFGPGGLYLYGGSAYCAGISFLFSGCW